MIYFTAGFSTFNKEFKNHFFLMTFSVSKVRSSHFCLYFFHTVFLPLFSPNFQQSSTISSRSPSNCGLTTYLLGEYYRFSSYHLDLRNVAWSSSFGIYICRLRSPAPIFFKILLILIMGSFSKGPFPFASYLLLSEVSFLF